MEAAEVLVVRAAPDGGALAADGGLGAAGQHREVAYVERVVAVALRRDPQRAVVRKHLGVAAVPDAPQVFSARKYVLIISRSLA